VSKSELVARRWLRLDAFYCALAGVLALALCVPLARLFEIPFALVAGIGIATTFWAWVLTRLARRERWRQPLQLVAATNAAASAGVAVLAALTPAAAPRLLLIAVAVEVAAFAAVQLRVLRHARSRR
jgi:predicted permease